MDIPLVKRMIAEQRPFRDCDISVLLRLDLTKHVLETAPKEYNIPKNEHKGDKIVYLQNASPEIVRTAVTQKVWSGQTYFYYKPLEIYKSST